MHTVWFHWCKILENADESIMKINMLIIALTQDREGFE